MKAFEVNTSNDDGTFLVIANSYAEVESKMKEKLNIYSIDIDSIKQLDCNSNHIVV